MATTIFQEPGSSATGGLEFYGSIIGTVATDSSVFRKGGRSVKFSTGAGSATAYAPPRGSGVLADAGRRISYWFRFDALPAANTIIVDARALFSSVFTVLLNTTGTLNNTPVGATPATGTAVLAINTWYRISIGYIITNATTFTIKVYVNGVLDSTTNAGTLTNTNTGTMRFQLSSTAGANKNSWISDVYIDNGTDSADPGNIGVTRKAPASNNTNNFALAIGANPANRWTNVNEVPISTTNGWEENAASAVQENYGLETAAQGDFDISNYTLVARTAWIWAKGLTGGAGPKMMDNGTETAVTLTA